MTMPMTMEFIIHAFLLLLTASYITANDCVVTSDQACSLSSLVTTPSTGSAYIFPGGQTRCAFDTGIAGGFRTNSTFFFEVFPSPQPNNRQVLLYFQGGGACVDNETCSYAYQCASAVPTFQANAISFHSAILNRSDPDNVFKDWNIVHVPYCTGDIHVGNRSVVLPDPTLEESLLLHPKNCVGKNMTLHQNGMTNSLAVLDWAQRNFPSPSQLVVSGSSAGALGAQLLAGEIASRWQVAQKQIPFAVLPDSYVGLSPPSKPVGVLLDMFGVCSVQLGWSAEVVAKCENKTLELVDLMEAVMKLTKTADWMMVNSNHDLVQRTFYSVIDVGVQRALLSLMTASQFETALTKVLDQYRAANPRFTSFLKTGEEHAFFTLSGWLSFRNQANETLQAALQSWLKSNAETTNAPVKASSAPRGFSVVGAVIALIVSIMTMQ